MQLLMAFRQKYKIMDYGIMGNESFVMANLCMIPKRERLGYLEKHVKKIICSYLHIEKTESLSPNTSFFDQGMTSLKAVELQYELEKFLGIKLNSTTLFNYPTFNKLLQFLTQKKLNSALVIQESESLLKSDDNFVEPYLDKNQQTEAGYAKEMLKKYFDI